MLLGVTVVGLVATVGMNFTVIIPPLAANVLGSDATGYGFLMTASGLGALGAAVALVIGGRPRPVRIALGAVVLGIASVALAFSTSFPLSLALMIPIGAGGITMAATANATIQLSVPDGLRGRVMSVYTTVFSASVPIGGIAAGALASVAGIPMTVAVGGLLSLAVGAGAYVWWRRDRLALAGEHRAASFGAGRRDGDRERRGSVDRAQHQRRVQAAEAERGAQHPPVGPDPAFAQETGQERRRVRIGLDEVDRRGRPSVADRERADRGLDRPRRPERMAIQRLRAAHRDRPGALAQGRARSPAPRPRRRSASRTRAR